MSIKKYRCKYSYFYYSLFNNEYNISHLLYKLSTDIKMKDQRGRNGANKTGFSFMIYNSLFLGSCLQYKIHNFLIWLRTGSNPSDINRFQEN